MLIINSRFLTQNITGVQRFAIELLVTNKDLLTNVLIIFIYTLVVFFIRSYLLRKNQISFKDIVIYSLVILNPFMFITHGYLFIIITTITIILSGILYFVTKLLSFYIIREKIDIN